MNFIQWIISIFKSSWFQAFLKKAITTLSDIIKKIGEPNYKLIKAKAIELNETNLTGKQKAAELFKYIKTLVPDLANNLVNMLIEAIVVEIQ